MAQLSRFEGIVGGDARRRTVAYFGAVALRIALLGRDTREIERSRCTFFACRADKTGLVTARRTMERRNFITRSKQKVARQAAMHLRVEKME